MGKRFVLLLLLMAGCTAPTTQQATQQVPAGPFADARSPLVQTKVAYAPASQDTSYQVELIRGKLVGENPKFGLRPYVTAIGSADPEIFHTSASQIYVTEALVRQCQNEGQLAAVLANEMGRIVSEREAAAADQTRNPERPLPIHLPIAGNGNAREADPIHYIELAQFEKQHPKQTKRLPPPNVQHVARTILENAGYQRTELDSAAPLLQNAERFRTLENQFKGIARQGDWKTP